MRDVTQHSTYGGWTIWTRNYCGMWKATRYDRGSLPLAADTLAGMRAIIRYTNGRHGGV